MSVRQLYSVILIVLGMWVAQAQAQPLRILVLNSYQAGSQWDAQFEQGLRQKIAERPVWIYSHRIEPIQDTLGSFSNMQQLLLQELLFYYQFDQVITVGPKALSAALLMRKKGSIQVPIVAAGTDLSAYIGQTLRPITGVHEQYAVRENLLLIKQLHPQLNSVKLLLDFSPASERIKQEFKIIAQQMRIAHDVWQLNSYEELKAKASTLSPQDILLFGILQQSSGDALPITSEHISSLSLAAGAPIYSLWAHPIGAGVIGGLVTSPVTLGEEVAKISLQLEKGTDLTLIPINESILAQYVFDEEQLKRWKISRNTLPKGGELQRADAEQNGAFTWLFWLLISLTLIVFPCIGYFLFKSQDRNKSKIAQLQTQLNALFHQTQEAVVLLNPEGEVVMANQAFRLFVGEMDRDIEGLSIFAGQWWDSRPERKSIFTEHLKQATAGHIVGYHWESPEQLYYINLTPQFDSGRQVLAVVLEITTLDTLYQQHQQLLKRELHYRKLFEENPGVVFLSNSLGIVTACNPHAAQQLGYLSEKLVLAQLKSLYSYDADKAAIQQYLSKVKRNGNGSRKVAYQHKDGRQLWFNELVSYIADEKVFLFVAQDITATYKIEQDLFFHANYDPLTNLFNRGYFERYLGKLLDAEQDQEHALLIVDIAQLKVINDTFGHSSGDQALKQAAAVLQSALPDNPTVARLGSDEFAVLLENKDQESALALADILLNKIKDTHFVRDEKVISMGSSIGLALFDSSSENAQSLISQADKACFSAKSLGRDRLFVYHHDDASLQQRQGQMEWVGRIQQAIRDERFLLYAQPIVPVVPEGKNYLHYEVLIRLIDEQGRIVPPGMFLPAAENYNLADKIDRVVVSKTLDWLSENPGHLTKLNMCSINLSGQSLGNSDFVQWLLNTLQQSALPMGKLCFETTETVAISNLSVAMDFFTKLRNLGCKIALDDFGSGLSSFGYLKQLPLDYLKIDGIFIRDLEHDKTDAAIVRSINQLAQVMGKKTVAEFVESEAINQILADIGVDYAQGYHFGKPVPIEMVVLN